MPIRKASNKSATNPAPTDWAKHEFQHALLPNQHLVKRLILLTTDFALQPTASIPQACGSWSQAKAAYRFFDNDAIDPDDILASHVQATIHRAAAHPVVLCAQDTTTRHIRKRAVLDPSAAIATKPLAYSCTPLWL